MALDHHFVISAPDRYIRPLGFVEHFNRAEIQSVEGATEKAANERLAYLLRRHETYLRRFIARRSGPKLLSKTTIEDLYQDTVTNALHSVTVLPVDDDVFPHWIATVARRTIWKTVRRIDQLPDAVRLRGPLSSGLGLLRDCDLDSPQRTPSSDAAWNEREMKLYRTIELLRPDYREAIRLYKIQQLPLDEVAVRMGRSKRAVCNLVARASKELLERFESW